jgi:regulator of protease activity HflC (stomatin/prohibitin superfamily)
MNSDRSSAGAVIGWSIGGIFFLMLIVLVGMVGCPQYAVYEQRLTGEAELARAQQNRQIAVNEAQAKMDAAKLLAQAEIERAKGVAGANAIISKGLEGNEAYLRYLWINEVAGKAQTSVVYVPTEAAIPILEAGKRK